MDAPHDRRPSPDALLAQMRDAEAAATAMLKHLETAKHYLVLAIDQIEKEKAAEGSPPLVGEADTGVRRGARS